MKTVRLNQFGGPEVLEIVDLPDPHPGPGQLRIAVRAASAPAPGLSGPGQFAQPANLRGRDEARPHERDLDQLAAVTDSVA